LIKIKREFENPSSKEVQKMITNLTFQVEEARRIDEACKSQLEENLFLEVEIVAQRKEADKRENILTMNLKSLNKLEAKFSQ
jgi:hypothetical protein